MKKSEVRSQTSDRAWLSCTWWRKVEKVLNSQFSNLNSAFDYTFCGELSFGWAPPAERAILCFRYP